MAFKHEWRQSEKGRQGREQNGPKAPNASHANSLFQGYTFLQFPIHKVDHDQTVVYHNSGQGHHPENGRLVESGITSIPIEDPSHDVVTQDGPYHPERYGGRRSKAGSNS